MDGTRVVYRRHYDGRQASPRWTFLCPSPGFVIRNWRGDAGPMKDRRSKLLRAFVADLERSARWTKADEAFFKRLEEEYPYGVREPVFCWLWVNFDQVFQVRHWQGGRLARIGWEGIAQMMREDGVVGSRGEPPNANSVRRVWARVCQDKEERAAREAAELDR